MSKEKKKVSNEKLRKLCEDFLAEKERAENFESVVKKEFYKAISKERFSDDKLFIPLGCNNKDEGYSITRVVKSKISFDMNKLREKIPKEEYKSITKKEVKVTNGRMFLQILKDAGISFSSLKKCITVEDVFDEKKLEQDLQVGKVDKSLISKYSTVDFSEPYFVVKRT